MSRSATEATALRREIEELRRRLAEAEDALGAIREGAVDALIIATPGGDRVFSLTTADRAYRQLVEAMPVGAATITGRGDISYANACFARLVDASLETVIGAALVDFLDDPALLGRVLRSGEEHFDADTELRARDGRRVPVHLVFGRLPANEAPAAYSVVAVDLTERRQHEEVAAAEARLQTALEVAELGAWDFDLLSGRAHWSASMQALLGFSDADQRPALEAWRERIHPDDLAAVVAGWEAACRTHDDFASEHRVVRADGAVRTVRARGRFRYDDAGRAVRMVGALLDVTEQRRTHEHLRAAAERHRSIFASSPTGIAVVEAASGRFEQCNRAYEELLGYSEADLRALSFSELVHPADRAANMALTERQRAGELPYFEIENRFVRKGGEPVWVRKYVSALRDASGAVTHSVALVTDMTERRRAEERLRDSEERLKLAQAAAHLGIHDFDVARGTIAWDDTVRALWGVGRDEQVTYETFIGGVHPEDRAVVQLAVDRALDPAKGGRLALDYRVVHRASGETRWVAATGQAFFADGRAVRLVGTVQDVSARKAAEEALRASEQRLRLAAETAGFGIHDYDVAADRSVWSRELYRIMGVAPGSEVGLDTVRATVHPEDRERVEDAMQRALDPGGRGEFAEEFRIRRVSDGAERWVYNRARTLFSSEAGRPAPVRTTGVVVDVTAQKHAEAALRASEARARDALTELEAVYEQAPIGLCVLDRELRFQRINERLAAMNGVPRAAHVGRTVREVVPALGDAAERIAREVFATGEPAKDVELVGETDAEPGCQRVWCEHWYPLQRDGEVVGINVVVEDITVRRAAQHDRDELVRMAERARAEAEASRVLLDSIERLVDVSTGATALDDMLAVLAELVQRTLQTDTAEILLRSGGVDDDDVDEAGDVLRVRAAFGVDLDVAARVGVPVGQGFAGRIAATGEPLLLERVDYAQIVSPYIAEMGLRSLAGVPLRSDGHVLGVLYVGSLAERAFGAADVRLMEFAAERVVLALVRTLATRRQVRAEAALRESEARLRAFLDNSAVIAWLKDEDGRYVYLSSNYERRFAVRQAEWQGKTDFEVWPPREADEFRRNDLAVLEAPEGHLEVVEQTTAADGHPTYWLNNKFVLESGGERYVGGLGVDITDRQHAEDALREAAVRKDEFLAMLAHELRNPLAPIRNAMHVVRLLSASQPQLARTTEIIDRQVTHMTRLIDDLLDVSRITRGKIELKRERLLLGDVLEAAFEATQPVLEAARHTLSVARAPAVWLDGDRARLVQIFTNLLSNAAKFTPPGGRVEVGVQVAEDRVAVSVRDTGVGMTKVAQARIFDLFAQEDVSLDRARGGLGIGLTLVKRLAEMHGGSVRVHSEGPDAGAEFTIVLPRVAEAPRAEPADAPDAVPRTGPLRILVVEDNPDAAESFELLLQLDGHDTRVACDGLEALRIFAEFDPDAAFIDLGLPGIDGFGVAERIRASAGDRPLLVALSGYGRDEDKSRAQAAGFDLHLTKPVDHRQVEALLLERTGAARGEGTPARTIH